MAVPCPSAVPAQAKNILCIWLDAHYVVPPRPPIVPRQDRHWLLDDIFCMARGAYAYYGRQTQLFVEMGILIWSSTWVRSHGFGSFTIVSIALYQNTFGSERASCALHPGLIRIPYGDRTLLVPFQFLGIVVFTMLSFVPSTYMARLWYGPL